MPIAVRFQLPCVIDSIVDMFCWELLFLPCRFPRGVPYADVRTGSSYLPHHKRFASSYTHNFSYPVNSIVVTQ